MTNSINTSFTELIYHVDEKSHEMKFIILIVFQIISILCYIFVLYNFLINKNLRQSIYNNSILCLLIVSFIFILIPLSISESYLHRSYVLPNSNMFCSLWNWFQYSCDVSNLHLMAYTSIERHLLIFYSRWLQNKWRCRLLHYFPLIFSIIYPIIFYFIVIFFTNCQIVYDFTQLLCTWPCYFDIWPLTIYDVLFNTLIPLLVIPIFSFALFIRVLYQKRRMRLQIFKWKRDRKMTLQLLFISLLYLIFWLPSQIFGLMNTFYMILLPQFQSDFIDYFVVFVHLLFPFVCLLSYPEMLKRIHWQPLLRAIGIIPTTRVEVIQPPMQMIVLRKNINNSLN